MKLKSLISWVSLTSGIGIFIPNLSGEIQANAQIIPDKTLGSEKSVVNTIEQLKEQISGGAVRGTNLFHSFQEFNVGESRSVYFTNPAGIENILTRITGKNSSNILGKLGVLGGANLFLINPNGIFFGPHASLDIRGSFIATTADEIRLGENGLFSATKPENSNLLSVEPSALFFNQIAAETRGNIVIKSTAEEVGLQIPTGETLGLVGGNVIIDGGMLTAQQGRIELGSVGDNSLVRVDTTQTGYALNYLGVENFQDIQLNNSARVNVSGEGSGDVQVQGRRVTLTGASEIVGNTQGSQPGGTLSVTASESVEMIGGFLNADVELGATGTGATLTTNTQRLTLSNGAQIGTGTSATSSSGELKVNANEIEVIGVSTDGRNLSGLFTDVLPGATGNGGDVTINTQSLKLLNGGQIGANVFGAGKGGNLTINATEIEAIGSTEFKASFPQQELLLQALGGRFPSAILAIVIPDATGTSGNMTVNTQRLTMDKGAQIGTGTFGSGDSGDLTVKADRIELIGTSINGRLPTSLFTSVLLEVTGNGGNLTVDTQQLSLRNGGQVRAGTSGIGDSGNLTVRANQIELIGRSDNGRFPSSILATVEDLSDLVPGAIGSGNGGDIFIESDRLTIQNGAEISASTFGEGKAGSLTINATENITLSGVNSLTGNSSAITASTESGATEAGGNLNISTPTLNLSNAAVVTARSRSNFSGGNITLNVDTLNLTSGAQILTSSFSEGNAGTISINANSPITLSGSDFDFNDRVAKFGAENIDTDGAETAIASRARGNGNAGSITINTPDFRVEDQATVTVSSSGSGVAGSLNITAPSIQLNNGTLSAETAAGDQGNITLKAQEINLQNNSAITTNATNTATGGDININTQFIIGSDNSNITANAVEGQGGNISIGAEGVFLDNNSQITATSALGIDGTVDLNTQVDPTQGVVRLSATVIDAESLVAKNLCAPNRGETEGSSFVITGRGGLPPNPTQPLTVLRGIVGWETDEKIAMSDHKQPVTVYHRQESAKLPEIRQAQGWVMTQNGTVTLTATSPIVNSGGSQLIHPSCYLFTSKGS